MSCTSTSINVLIRIGLVTLLTVINLHPAWSQDDAAPATATPSMADLLQQVTETAKNLETNVENFAQSMQDAQNSADSGRKLLDEMETTVKSVNESLEKDSDIWMQLDALLADWEKKRQAALDKAETVPAFEEIAAKWADKVKQAGELRKSILEQRAESASLVDALAERREVILAYYELNQADEVLKAMNEINDNFKTLNAGMDSIVKQAEQAAGPQVAQ